MRVVKVIAIISATGAILLGILAALRARIQQDFGYALAVFLISAGALLIAGVAVAQVAGTTNFNRGRPAGDRVPDVVGDLCGEVCNGLIEVAGSYSALLGVAVFLAVALFALLMARRSRKKRQSLLKTMDR